MKKSLALLVLLGCSSSDKKKDTRSLYERLGGTAGIALVTDDFVDRCYNRKELRTPEVDEAFNKTPRPGFKFHLTAFLIEATGGPVKYTGREVEAGHRHLNLTDREWDLAIEELKASFNHFKVGEREQKEATEALAGLKPKVIAKEKFTGMRPALEKIEGDSLYARLGGSWAIASVVDEFLERLLVNDKLNANPKIKAARGRVPKQLLKFQVTALVCEVTGGPQKYSGRSMKESHQDLEITGSEWDAMAADFKAVLDKIGVPEKEQKELFDIVGGTKADIVKYPDR
jgi:hemoglobin